MTGCVFLVYVLNLTGDVGNGGIAIDNDPSNPQEPRRDLHRSKELCWPRAFQGGTAPMGPRHSIGGSSLSHMISRKNDHFLRVITVHTLYIMHHLDGKA